MKKVFCPWFLHLWVQESSHGILVNLKHSIVLSTHISFSFWVKWVLGKEWFLHVSAAAHLCAGLHRCLSALGRSSKGKRRHRIRHAKCLPMMHPLCSLWFRGPPQPSVLASPHPITARHMEIPQALNPAPKPLGVQSVLWGCMGLSHSKSFLSCCPPPSGISFPAD